LCAAWLQNGLLPSGCMNLQSGYRAW
jgi:hypothetical protein